MSQNDKKPANTAAFSQLGNLYQYLIVLECCLDLPEGEIVNIEQLGDITYADYQYEIKHHADSAHQLIDTHIDFWKTISNWVENRDILIKYRNLVLITSSCVRSDSLVGDWNNLEEKERIDRLVQLKEKILTSEKEYSTIKKYVQKVSDFISQSHANAEGLFNKITIKHSYDNATLLWERLKKHQGLLAIPLNQRTTILTSLLGFIGGKGITSTSTWDIEVSEFHEYLRERANEIKNNEHIEYPDLANIEIGTQYDDHRFIKEIHKIPYSEKVQLAAKDYYCTSVTISRMADQNPHVINAFQSEIDQIGIELQTKKENACFMLSDKSAKLLIKNSKMLYNDSMLNLKASEKYSKGAKKDFHRGLIHTHVDNSEFTWKIQESDFED